MSEISATDASKHFADMLDAVEHRGEAFTVMRRGRAIAIVAPASPHTLGPLREFIHEHSPDDAWEDDLVGIRRDADHTPSRDPWPD